MKKGFGIGITYFDGSRTQYFTKDRYESIGDAEVQLEKLMTNNKLMMKTKEEEYIYYFIIPIYYH